MKPKTDPRESKRRPLNLKTMTKMPIVRTKLKPTELPQIEKKIMIQEQGLLIKT